ncbi:magnesium-protoporphyrin IX monomethyl ester oxidative cyclase [Striga asiatica]|uniref:Magnesium-protoporphyrin IX monomethyl ester oxidative cyclase n=1 Tax=Striga asiatica TaxID=4170 RepID=A0A5A7QVS8_STRAF|nr:magnesium-protoporphyrin IX monomethyl ester oxidative cyclase [Striga asiatica]
MGMICHISPNTLNAPTTSKNTHVETVIKPSPSGSGPFTQNLNHTTVDLDGHNFLGGLKELESEIPGAGSDFQNSIIGLHARSPNDGVQHSRVGQEVLPSAFKKTYLPFFFFFFSVGFPAKAAGAIAGLCPEVETEEVAAIVGGKELDFYEDYGAKKDKILFFQLVCVAYGVYLTDVKMKSLFSRELKATEDKMWRKLVDLFLLKTETRHSCDILFLRCIEAW